LGKHRNFGQTSKFWPNIEILGKHRNFGQTSKFWPNIEILAKHGNFGEKSKCWSNVEIFVFRTYPGKQFLALLRTFRFGDDNSWSNCNWVCGSSYNLSVIYGYFIIRTWPV